MLFLKKRLTNSSIGGTNLSIGGTNSSIGGTNMATPMIIETHIIRKKPRDKWTLALFLTEAKILHGNMYDYGEVKAEHIQYMDSAKSKVPLKCNTCAHQWSPTIGNHINSKNGCPVCAGKIPWTLERFLLKTREIHGNKFDYIQVKEEHIKGQKAKVPLKCNTCTYKWYPTINDHINGCYGCPDCADKVPWTLVRFLESAGFIHEDNYDYSLIRPEDIQGKDSKIKIKCKKCLNVWNTTSITHHVNHKTGCPRCNRSHVEIACENILKQLNITFQQEVILDSLPRKRFDFRFHHMNKWYLIEFDGEQHFKYSPMFHQYDEKVFEQKKKIDIRKTWHAVRNGYRLIRIDYTQVKNVQQHIEFALKHLTDTQPIYWSNPSMYEYIISGLGIKQIKSLI